MRSSSRGRGALAGDRRLAALLLAPALLTIAGVAVYPILDVIWLSLHRRYLTIGLNEYVFLSNYADLAADPRFWRSLFNTLYFTFLSVSLEFLLGLGIALVLHRSFKGRGWIRAAVLVPWAIPTVVCAKMWEWIYNPGFGVLNYLLRLSGLVDHDINWLGSQYAAIHAAVIVDVWKTTPFVALILLAGLQVIPDELYRAAKVDGAGPLRSFLSVTLPLLKPVILVAVLFRTLDAFRVFDVIYVLTGGGPANSTETLSVYAYQVLFQTLNFGYGSTISVVTFAVVMAISVFYIRILARESVS